MTTEESYKSLLGIIDTLHRKLQDMTVNLWLSEQKIIHLEQQLNESNQQVEDLQQYIKHQNEEIEDLNNILNTSTDADKYFKVLEEKEALSQKYDLLKNKFDMNSQAIKSICDIEYTM